MSKMALVLQGGGALGAYEWGVVTKLVEMGWEPVAVTGVSIGAINAAAIAGAKDGNIRGSMKAIWDDITIGTVPFLPANMQGNLSLLGNPKFWQSRTNVFEIGSWTSWCVTDPMVETLGRHLDFKRMNDSAHVRLGVVATSLQTGGPTAFSNHLEPGAHTGGQRSTGNGAHAQKPKLHAKKTEITAAHIMASGALPPGFPAVTIDDCAYWDGGLFSNTPIDALLNMLSADEIETLPIFTIDLFSVRNQPLPKNLMEVQARSIAMQYQNRFWAEYGGDAGHEGFTQMLAALERELPADSELRTRPDSQAAQAWRWMQRLKALKNIHVIEGPAAPAGGDHDFSAYAVQAACEAGRASAAGYTPAQLKPAQLRAVA